MLPDMDSIELISRLMALDPEAQPHLLLCTYQLDLGCIMRAKRAGAKGYILKPFERTQLLESVRALDFAA